jgi:hypothetical protein
MSFIAITYGYNQFQIFNTNVSTLPLVDNIIMTCLDDIHLSLDLRAKAINKELEDLNNDEENLKKTIKRLEENKLKEEERAITEPKTLDSSTKNIKKDSKNNKTLVSPKNIEKDSLNAINEEMKTTDTKLQNISAIKEKILMKKKLLQENKEKINEYDKKTLKIDLVDCNGDRANISTRGDCYAKEYLIDKQCYELHRQYNSNILIKV